MTNYNSLSPTEAIQHLQKHLPAYSDDNTLRAYYLNSSQQSVDSYANIVMRITSSNGNPSVILKQVLPYVRAAQEQGIHMPLEQDRIYSEVSSLFIWNKIKPGSVPKVYHFDSGNFIILMEDLQGMRTLRSELIKRKRYPKFPKQIGTFLAHSAYYTSINHLNHTEKRMLDKMMDHMDTDAFWTGVIFDRILMDSHPIMYSTKADGLLLETCKNQKIRTQVLELKSRFVGNKQCLIHNDLHTSNIFISEECICIYDSEYASYGPISFDLGRMIGNILLNIASLHVGIKSDEAERKSYQNYLISVIRDILEYFSQEYKDLWDLNANGRLNQRDQFITRAIQEGLGLAACTALFRLFNVDSCFDIKRIENIDQQAHVIALAIHISRDILYGWKTLQSPAEFEQLLKTSLLCSEAKLI